MTDKQRGRDWVRNYPEVSLPLVDLDHAEALAYIDKHYDYANPPANASDDFFEGAREEAERDPWWEDWTL